MLRQRIAFAATEQFIDGVATHLWIAKENGYVEQRIGRREWATKQIIVMAIRWTRT